MVAPMGRDIRAATASWAACRRPGIDDCRRYSPPATPDVPYGPGLLPATLLPRPRSLLRAQVLLLEVGPLRRGPPAEPAAPGDDLARDAQSVRLLLEGLAEPGVMNADALVRHLRIQRPGVDQQHRRGALGHVVDGR